MGLPCLQEVSWVYKHLRFARDRSSPSVLSLSNWLKSTSSSALDLLGLLPWRLDRRRWLDLRTRSRRFGKCRDRGLYLVGRPVSRFRRRRTRSVLRLPSTSFRRLVCSHGELVNRRVLSDQRQGH
jgi:hypothetical protein